MLISRCLQQSPTCWGYHVPWWIKSLSFLLAVHLILQMELLSSASDTCPIIAKSNLCIPPCEQLLIDYIIINFFSLSFPSLVQFYLFPEYEIKLLFLDYWLILFFQDDFLPEFRKLIFNTYRLFIILLLELFFYFYFY